MSPWGVSPFDDVRKRGSGFYRFSGFGGDGAAHKIMKAPWMLDWRYARIVIPSEAEEFFRLR